MFVYAAYAATFTSKHYENVLLPDSKFMSSGKQCKRQRSIEKPGNYV